VVNHSCESVLFQSGTNRRPTGLESLAGAAGRAVDPSVHRRRLFMERFQEAPRRGVARLRHAERAALYSRHRGARAFCGDLRHLGRPQRTARCHVRRDVLLLRRLARRFRRPRDPPVLAGAARLRAAWWNRLGRRLHLAGLDFDEMVPRQAGDGDRAGDHGFRWWRADRVAVVDGDARPLRYEHRRYRKDILGARHRLCRFHVTGLVARPGAEGGLETARLDSCAADGWLAGEHRPGLGQQRDQDTAVLAAVGCVVLQRDCGYRDTGEGVADLSRLFSRRRKPPRSPPQPQAT